MAVNMFVPKLRWLVQWQCISFKFKRSSWARTTTLF